jgi:pimeloyl-ACP methyl ester carboxylesterase
MPRGFVCRLWSVALSLLAVSAPGSAWAAWAGGPWSPVVANPDPAHVIVEDVAYLSGGLIVLAQICRPASATPGRVILRQHGGFEGLGQIVWKDGVVGGVEEFKRGWYMDSFCVDRAREGYVVALSAYRGEPLIHDSTPENGVQHYGLSQGSIEVCRGEADDVRALLAELSTRTYVQKVKGVAPFVAWGESHGGCISEHLALSAPAGMRGLVDWYSPAEAADLWRYYDHQLQPVGSPPSPGEPRESDPSHYAGSMGCPGTPTPVAPQLCAMVHSAVKTRLEESCGGTPATASAAYAQRSWWNDGRLASSPVPRFILHGTHDYFIHFNQACYKRLGLILTGKSPVSYCYRRDGSYAPVDASGKPAECAGICDGAAYDNRNPESFAGDFYFLMYRDQGHAFEPGAWNSGMVRAWTWLRGKLDAP